MTQLNEIKVEWLKQILAKLKRNDLHFSQKKKKLNKRYSLKIHTHIFPFDITIYPMDFFFKTKSNLSLKFEIVFIFACLHFNFFLILHEDENFWKIKGQAENSIKYKMHKWLIYENE